MIKFVEKSPIDFHDIESILSESSQTGWFANNGPAKINLERYLANLLNLPKSKKVLCCSSGTSALHALMMYYSKSVEHEFKWASPSFTFPSCAVGNFSCTFFDICDSTYTLPLVPEDLSEFDGVIITNLFGTYPDNLLEWEKHCKTSGKVLLLDNASSFMTTISGDNICTFGDASFGSLHHTKFMGFGEGGFVVVDAESYENVSSITSFGFKNNPGGKREYSENSSNFKMSDVSAAFIHSHMLKYDICRHLDIQDRFLKSISGIEDCKAFNFLDGVVYGNFPVVFSKSMSCEFFHERGIEAKKYYSPLSPHKNSENLYDRMINFPLNCLLKERDINSIIVSIKEAALL